MTARSPSSTAPGPGRSGGRRGTGRWRTTGSGGPSSPRSPAWPDGGSSPHRTPTSPPSANGAWTPSATWWPSTPTPTRCGDWSRTASRTACRCSRPGTPSALGEPRPHVVRPGDGAAVGDGDVGVADDAADPLADAHGEQHGHAAAADHLGLGVHGDGVAPAGRRRPLQGTGLDHRVDAACDQLVPRQAVGGPPRVGGLVGPGQVVAVEDDALLVALDVPDRGAPLCGHGAPR